MVSAQGIQALAYTTAAVNGLTGGTTSSLASNDKLNGTLMVNWNNSGDVILLGVIVPAGFILNANGTVTIAPNTAAGTSNSPIKYVTLIIQKTVVP